MEGLGVRKFREEGEPRYQGCAGKVSVLFVGRMMERKEEGDEITVVPFNKSCALSKSRE
jgi:hypothetical protein